MSKKNTVIFLSPLLATKCSVKRMKREDKTGQVMAVKMLVLY